MSRIARVSMFAVTVLASADRAPPDDPSIPYTVTRDGRVSLAVYDGRGRLVRTLLIGAPVAEGGQRLYVDGKVIATGKLAARIKTGNRLGLDLGPGGETAVVRFSGPANLGRSRVGTIHHCCQLRNTGGWVRFCSVNSQRSSRTGTMAMFPYVPGA